MQTNIDLSRKTKAVIAAVIILILAVGSGISFTNQYNRVPVTEMVAPGVTKEMVEEYMEENKTEEPQSETKNNEKTGDSDKKK